MLDKITAFLQTPLGNGILIFICFLAVIAFLRRVFGPGGRLREAAWDTMQAEQQIMHYDTGMHNATDMRNSIGSERSSYLENILAPELQAFDCYARSFLNGNKEHDAMHLVKREHSMRVLKQAWAIAMNEDVFRFGPHQSEENPKPLEADKILLLSALYHDLGRFEQLKRFNTFIDSQSINHAALSCKLLHSTRFMPEHSPLEKSLVRWAVAVHNRADLSVYIPQCILPVCQALRDADKLDIINIMRQELAPGHEANRSIVLFRPDEPEKYSPVILNAVKAKQTARYDDMRCVNDFRLILCGWIYTLNFKTSRRILARSGYIETIMQGLPDLPEILEFKTDILKDLSAWK